MFINQTDFKLNQWSQESYFTNDFEFKLSKYGYRFAIAILDLSDGFNNVDRYDEDYASFHMIYASWNHYSGEFIM